MIDNAIKGTFIQRRAEGFSFDKISKEINVSKPTLLKWEADFKTEISEARFTYFEALVEQFQLMKQNRIRAFGEILRRINEELSKRKLEDISTEKLLAMALNVDRKLIEELRSIHHSVGGFDSEVSKYFDEGKTYNVE